MKNEVYEADYTRKTVELPESNGVFDIAVASGFFKKYNEIMRSIPKYIVQKDKQAYEELLPKLDALAKRRYGKIKGIVDYERWDSHIYVTLPFFEFSHDEEHELLKELNEKAHSLTFSCENGMVHLSVMINYFEEIGDTEEVFDLALEGNEELMSALFESHEKRKEEILEHPVIGQLVGTAAANLDMEADEFVEKAVESDGSDPEMQLKLLRALIEAKDELFGTET